ncbi:MAG: PDZ domain-containing protein [Actinobacteria bacterium]|nr:MAG: PDZ domain-containing protein [Actinomycetota bacterium]
MLSKRTPYLLAASALALGAGAGAGSYAAFGGQSGKTTTIVQQAAAQGSPAAATKTMSVNGVYQADRNGVVEVTTTTTSAGSNNNAPFPFGGSQSSQAQGSGFVYDSDGHIITNNHVVSGASSISVTFADGSKYSAKVVGADPSSDLAVLKVDAPSSKLHPLTLGDSTKLEVGDGVVAIGSPFGLSETVTSSTISQVVSKLVKGQKVAHPYLGVYVKTSTNRSGAQIASVKSGSPAAAAGLKAGDVVTAFDGGTITSPDDLTAAVAAKRPGDKVSVTYVRSGSTKTTQVTIGTRPS